MTNVSDVLDALTSVIAARRSADPDTSYVASLNAKGLNKILEKVGEEAVEAIIAAKDAESGNGSSTEVINEVADLVFHTLVMLDRLGISHNGFSMCWPPDKDYQDSKRRPPGINRRIDMCPQQKVNRYGI